MINWSWCSDWNGDEVGFDEVAVVGLYSTTINDTPISAYINAEDGKILEIWVDEE